MPDAPRTPSAADRLGDRLGSGPETVVCAECGGKGSIRSFVCRDGGFARGTILTNETIATCSTCGGAGCISADFAARLAEGRRRRSDRVLRGLSQREEAQRLGIDPRELNEMEKGIIPYLQSSIIFVSPETVGNTVGNTLGTSVESVESEASPCA